MPRSKRAYGDVLPATLANAIAFVHFAQTTRGIHMSTCSALMKLYEFRATRPHYEFTEEALKLAEKAPLWKACKWLVDNGYVLRSFHKHDMRSIEFWNAEAHKYGNASRYGEVFLYPENGRWAEVIDGIRHDYTKRFKPE